MLGSYPSLQVMCCRGQRGPWRRARRWDMSPGCRTARIRGCCGWNMPGRR